MRKFSLFMLMAVGLLISGNLRAENEVCQIVETSTTYENLQAAFDAATSGQTVQMIADIEFTQASGNAYVIAEGKNVVFDLNGHSIKVTSTENKNTSVIANAGTLEVKDSKTGGLIWLKSCVKDNNGAATILNVHDLTITSGTIQNATVATPGANYYIAYAIDNDVEWPNGDYHTQWYDITCTINGGHIISYGEDDYIVPAIRLYDRSDNSEKTAPKSVSFTMNGGIIEGQRGIYIAKTNIKNSTNQIQVNIKGGTIIGHGNTSNGDRPWAIDVEADGSNSNFEIVNINIEDGDIDGKISLGRSGGRNFENLSIAGGNFTYHNAILDGHKNDSYLHKCISGGTFFFNPDAKKKEPTTYVTEIQFASDWGGDYAKGYDEFHKYYGDLANRAGWEALGYTVEKISTPSGREGNWYAIVTYTTSTEDYSNFLTYIADDHTAVDITGQDNPLGGKYPDKTVEIKQVTKKTIVTDGKLEAEPNEAVTIKANVNVTDAEVEVYSLNVESGSLTVGADATVIVGAGGVTKNSVITVEADASGMGVFKIDPSYEMTEDNRPTISVDLYTKARTVDGVSYWQFFARPTGVTPTEFYPTAATSDRATIHNIYGWDAEKKEYVPIMNKEGLRESFTGYAISNNSPAGGVVYHFEGKLNENENGKLPMTNSGFNLVGNSYIAPVALKDMLASIAVTEGLGDKVELSIWYYDCDNGSFKAVTSLRSKNYQLQPLQGFFMYNMSNSAIDNAQIDYLNAVWNNNASAGPLPAPAHDDVEKMTMAQIVVSANGNADIVEVFEDAQFSADFDNGADASKLMNPSGMFNLYSSDNLASVATDNLEGVQLTFMSNDASTYTMSFNEVAGDDFMILDKETGIYTAISNDETYTFQAQPNTTYADRFCLVADHKAPTNATKVKANKSVKGIYSIMGQYFGTNRNALPAGVYVENGQKIVK